MTSLTAEAAGFFSGRSCPRTGQSSPSDVAGDIDVGVDLLPTPPGSEYRLADTVARVEVPARVVHPTGMQAPLEGCVVPFPVCLEALAQGDVPLGRRREAELVSSPRAASTHWRSMYRRGVSSDTYPTEAARYALDHSTFPGASQGNSALSCRDVRPLNLRATSARKSVARTRTKVCTWPGITSRGTIRQVFSAAISSSILFRRCAARPPRRPLGYFGHHRMCGPSDVTPPLQRRKRASNMTGSNHSRGAKLTGRPGTEPRAPISPTAEAAGPGEVI